MSENSPNRPPKKRKKTHLELTPELYKREFNQKPAESFRKIGPEELKESIFARADGGHEILADLLNNKITNSQAAQRLMEQGIHNYDEDNNPVPYTKQSIQYHKKKLVEEWGYGLQDYDNVFFIPFLTNSQANEYLKKAQTELQQYDPNHASHKRFKVDPVIGLHMQVMELEAMTERTEMSLDARLKIWAFKTKIFEKIIKYDNNIDKERRKSELVEKLNKLSQFSLDTHNRLNNEFDNLVDLLQQVLGKQVGNWDNIYQILIKFREKLNIKDRYLEYIDAINVNENDIDEQFEPIEVDENEDEDIEDDYDEFDL